MKRGIGWPIGVAAVLAVTVGVNIWVAVIANDDPSFAIEQDYYKKGVEWDSTLAQQHVNERLGWKLVPALGSVTRGANTALNVQLVDAAGAPISDATVRVAAFYNARAGTVLEATLTRDAAGYEARLPIAHTGAWELRFDVRRGAERFTAVSRVDLVPSGP
jgi:nitrogen fixation protein FixH